MSDRLNLYTLYWSKFVACDYEESLVTRKHCELILREAIRGNWSNGVTYDMLMLGLCDAIRKTIMIFHSNSIFDVVRFSILATSIQSSEDVADCIREIQTREAAAENIDIKQCVKGLLNYKL